MSQEASNRFAVVTARQVCLLATLLLRCRHGYALLDKLLTRILLESWRAWMDDKSISELQGDSKVDLE